jgi:hypothetical protein
MPHGYFTIEQWQRPKGRGAGRWVPVLHLDASQSLTKAIGALEQRGVPGLFRVVQMQRCLWGEIENGKLRFHGSHASSPENLTELTELFDKNGGRRPVEKARQERAKAKADRAKK